MNRSKEKLNKWIYIVAKDFNKAGSLVLQVEKDSRINNLIIYLSQESLDTNVEIVETNNIEAYKEYYPIELIRNSKEFTIRALKMIE